MACPPPILLLSPTCIRSLFSPKLAKWLAAAGQLYLTVPMALNSWGSRPSPPHGKDEVDDCQLDTDELEQDVHNSDNFEYKYDGMSDIEIASTGTPPNKNNEMSDLSSHRFTLNNGSENPVFDTFRMPPTHAEAISHNTKELFSNNCSYYEDFKCPGWERIIKHVQTQGTHADLLCRTYPNARELYINKVLHILKVIHGTLHGITRFSYITKYRAWLFQVSDESDDPETAVVGSWDPCPTTPTVSAAIGAISMQDNADYHTAGLGEVILSADKAIRKATGLPLTHLKLNISKASNKYFTGRILFDPTEHGYQPCKRCADPDSSHSVFIDTSSYVHLTCTKPNRIQIKTKVNLEYEDRSVIAQNVHNREVSNLEPVADAQNKEKLFPIFGGIKRKSPPTQASGVQAQKAHCPLRGLSKGFLKILSWNLDDTFNESIWKLLAHARKENIDIILLNDTKQKHFSDIYVKRFYNYICYRGEYVTTLVHGDLEGNVVHDSLWTDESERATTIDLHTSLGLLRIANTYMPPGVDAIPCRDRVANENFGRCVTIHENVCERLRRANMALSTGDFNETISILDRVMATDSDLVKLTGARDTQEKALG